MRGCFSRVSSVGPQGPAAAGSLPAASLRVAAVCCEPPAPRDCAPRSPSCCLAASPLGPPWLVGFFLGRSLRLRKRERHLRSRMTCYAGDQGSSLKFQGDLSLTGRSCVLVSIVVSAFIATCIPACLHLSSLFFSPSFSFFFTPPLFSFFFFPFSSSFVLLLFILPPLSLSLPLPQFRTGSEKGTTAKAPKIRPWSGVVARRVRRPAAIEFQEPRKARYFY